jgi:hypothetical protein
MKAQDRHFRNEEGSIMVIALLMLVFLTLIGIAATTSTEIETQISGNEKFHKMAFYHTDSGIYATPKLISLCVDNGAPSSISGITYLNANGEADAGDSTLDDIFFNEIMGFDDLLGRDSHDTACDMRFSLDNHNVDIDINRTGQQSVAGGGTEFGSGSEGVGTGSTGGVALLFAMNSFGKGPGSSQSNIDAVYRKVVGVAGGI